MQLYNKLSAKERAALIDEAGKDRITISFYQYHHIKNPQIFRDKLFLEWNALDVLGGTYVSYEGINAQISVPAENFNQLKDQLDAIDFLKDIRLNVAVEHDNKSFLKLKVKVRQKIVADGLNDDTFDVTDKGVHLNNGHNGKHEYHEISNSTTQAFRDEFRKDVQLLERLVGKRFPWSSWAVDQDNINENLLDFACILLR